MATPYSQIHYPSIPLTSNSTTIHAQQHIHSNSIIHTPPCSHSNTNSNPTPTPNTNTNNNDPPPDRELSNSARMLSATIGAFITSLVVTPFDVVKTRLQAQIHALPGTKSIYDACTHYKLQTGLVDVWCHKCDFQAEPPYPHAPNSYHAEANANTTNSSTGTNNTSTHTNNSTVHNHTHNHGSNPTHSLHSIPSLQQQRQFPASSSIPHTHPTTITTTQTTPTTTLHPSHPIPLSSIAVPSSPHKSIIFHNSWDAFVKLLRYEGVHSLWRGLSPTLIHSIPSTVIYFWGYDKLKIALIQAAEQSKLKDANFTPHRSNHHSYTTNMGFINTKMSTSNFIPNHADDIIRFAPLIAGVSARALATIIVSPIELVKTKSQSLNRSVPAMSIVRAELKKGGFKSLWRGANPTLWRDVPFSAIYWTSYETIKAHMLERAQHKHTHYTHSHSHNHIQQYDHRRLVWTSFTAGAGSGMIAAAITHPFDLVKTRRQIEMYALHSSSLNASTVKSPSTTGEVFKTIVKEEGWLGLSAGLAARMGKIAPACAIMISTYELAKAKFGKRRDD